MTHGVRIFAFAGARDVLGAPELDFALFGPVTAAQLLADVCLRYPALAPYQRSIRVAVNGVYAESSEPVAPGDEVALIPPVAGG